MHTSKVSHQRKHPFDRRLPIGLSMEASFPACRVNWISARKKLSPANSLLLLGDNLQRRRLCTRDGGKFIRLKGIGAFPTVLAVLIVYPESFFNRTDDVVQHMIPPVLTLEEANGICIKRSGAPAVSLCFRQSALNFITLKDQPQPRILIVQLHLTICHGAVFFTSRNGSLQLHNARQVRRPHCQISTSPGGFTGGWTRPSRNHVSYKS